MKGRLWKFAFVFLVPLALGAYIAERNSWRPKMLSAGVGYSAFQVAFSHDSQRLAVACDNASGTDRPDRVMLWNVARRSLLWSFSTDNGQLGSIAFVPDSYEIASLHWGADWKALRKDDNYQDESWSVIRFHSDDSGKLRRTLRVPNPWMGQWASYLCFWPNKTTVFHKSDSFYLTNLINGRTNKLRFKPDPLYLQDYGSLALAPNGKTLAAIVTSEDESASLALFDLPSRKLRRWLKADDRDGENALAFSPDSSLLACDSSSDSSSSSPSYRLKLWDANTGKMRRLLFGLQAVAKALAFSPDNKILAAAGESGHVYLWSTSSGKLTRTLKHSKGVVFTIAFSPDGRTLATGGSDGTVKLWRIK